MDQDPAQPDSPPTLAYGHEEPPASPARVFGGLLGSLMMIGAVAAGLVGLLFLKYALFDAPTRDRPATFFQASVVFAIAIVCAIAAFRWIGYAGGRRS